VIAVTIYSRPGCHLCDDMKALVRRVAASAETPTAIEDVDISTDPDLEARYGLEIPVLLRVSPIPEAAMQPRLFLGPNFGISLGGRFHSNADDVHHADVRRLVGMDRDDFAVARQAQ